MAEFQLPLGSSSLPSGNVIPAARRQPSYGAWGLRLTAITYLTAFIIIPVLVVNVEGLSSGWHIFWDSITSRAALNAVKLTLQTSALMALINTVMGTLTAYVLVVYRFPGKRLFNTLVDLPFAIPTLVTGVMLVILYGPQTFIGAFLGDHLDIEVLYAKPGIVLALLFVGYPFVIRTVQPVLMALDPYQEEAAHTIGASPWRTFWRVIFPALRPAIVTGALLSFARSLGEFGSIIVVSGNIPNKTQTATVYIYAQVEGGNMQAASSVSVVLLLIAFAVTMTVDAFHWRRHHA